MTHKEILITAMDVDVLKRTIPEMVKWLRKLGGEISCSLVYVCDSDMEAATPLMKDIEIKRHQLEELADEFAKYGFDVDSTRVVVGSPAEEIANVAKELNAYALLLSVSNRSIPGSYRELVDRIIKKTPCPVVVFKPKLLKFTEKVSLILSSRFKKLSKSVATE